MTRVTVWNEFRHEKESEKVRSVYPEGIHKAIANGRKAQGGMFRPGHETFPMYHQREVLKVIGNKVRWAALRIVQATEKALKVEALEPFPR